MQWVLLCVWCCVVCGGVLFCLCVWGVEPIPSTVFFYCCCFSQSFGLPAGHWPCILLGSLLKWSGCACSIVCSFAEEGRKGAVREEHCCFIYLIMCNLVSCAFGIVLSLWCPCTAGW